MMRFLPGLLWLLLAALPAGADDFVLTVLHTNDVHARLEPANRFGGPCRPVDLAAGTCYGGSARLAAAVAAERAAGGAVLLLDAGDQFQGTLFHNRYKGAASAELMKLLRYDAMAVGNHEFDDGPAVLGRFAASLGFPLLAANLDVSGEPALLGRIAGSVVLRRDGRRIGLVGALTEDVANISRPGPNLHVGPVEPALRAAAAALVADGVDIVFALTHLGLAVDRRLARDVPGLDLVVGGHSHTVLGDGLPGSEGAYPVVERAADGAAVPVVQAGSWSRILGRLTLRFDGAGRVLDWRGAPLLLDAAVPSDPAAAAAVARLAGPLQALRAEQVGESRVDLAIETCRAVECRIGNLVASAMLEAAAPAGATIALENGGGLRAGMPAGPISRGQVLETLPFGNTLAVFSVTGADLRRALENGVAGDPGSGRLPQVAGLRYAFDPDRPVGSRVLRAEAANGDGFSPLDEAAVYRVVTNDFLRRGGDGYQVFRDGAIDAYDFGANLEDVLVAHLARHSPVEPPLDGRIHRVGG